MIRRMRRATRHRLMTLAAVITLSGGAAGTWALAGPDSSSDKPAPVATAQTAQDESPQGKGTERKAEDPRDSLVLDPAKFERVDDHYIQRLDDGRVVYLTLRPELQRSVKRQFDRRGKEVPHGGLAAIEPATGKVLALVSSSHRAPTIDNYAVKAQAPSASVFKLITAAALLEFAQVDPNRPVCFSGGRSHLSEEHIRGNPGADSNCADLGDAIGQSINPVLARLAYYNLTKQNLEEMALRFGFNREIPFEVPVEVSEARFVDDDIERARTAAGFWNVNLSPLHGALIAAAIANEGVMMRPTIVDHIVAPDGTTAFTSKPEPWLTTVNATRAHQIAEMGVNTTTNGTASKAFAKRNDWPDDYVVSGKTGTLSNKRPYLLFTWFVGSAPFDDPNIAVGALVACTQKWWIKGMHAAANAFLTYHDMTD